MIPVDIHLLSYKIIPCVNSQLFLAILFTDQSRIERRQISLASSDSILLIKLSIDE